MKNSLSEIGAALRQLFFPHICSGCGTDNLPAHSSLCLRCIAGLPETGFAGQADNPVEKLFAGRLPLIAAMAQFYFSPASLIQRLVHRFKYRGDTALGWQLGRMMGESLRKSERFAADALVPLPLFPRREKKRGYNQAELLCLGMSEQLQLPVWNSICTRPQYTETQTNKGRISRWKNMEGKFLLTVPQLIRHRHLLLVDDVVTTGATLEACGLALLQNETTRLSIAALCVASP